MRHLGRHLLLTLCLAATGSIASAAPGHHKKSHHAQPADDRDDGDGTVGRRDGTRVAHESWRRAREREDARDPGDDEVRPSRHATASRGRGTAAEDLFADDGERQARTRKHHVELDAPAADDRDAGRDDGRVALKKTARRHAIVETLPSDDETPAARGSHMHHAVVETLPSDDDAQVSRASRKHHAAVETLPSDDGVDDAELSPHKKTGRRAPGSHRKPAKHHADDDAEPSDERASAAEIAAAAAVAAAAPGLEGSANHPHAHDDAQPERVAFADPDPPAHAVDADTIQLDAPVRVHERIEPRSAKDWRIAFGPYLWASSVDANVSLGPTTVSSGVDFVQLEQHARYGMEFLSEGHYKQFAVYGDLMYGVVAVDGSRNVGPLMVSLNGEASSILIDGAAGYTFYGDDHSLLSLEARGGVRYQRTGVSAQLGLSGATVTPPEQVSAGADALAGGHVVVRPRDWLFLTGTADVGVVGASSRTWSASADANVQLGPRLLLSVGYRTLTMDRSQVDLVLHGPRAAVQLTF